MLVIMLVMQSCVVVATTQVGNLVGLCNTQHI
jgi:hypothetical protein